MIKALSYNQNSFLENRWWIYQKERFPIFKYGFLIAIFSGSAVGYASLTNSTQLNFWSAWGVAFLVAFGCFAQMRIADEFKDYKDDCRYRPHRAVPRGLVSRSELGWLGVCIGLVQLIAVCFFKLNILGYLLLIWIYFDLMCIEFGVKKWLKKHLGAYMLSHMVILPLIALFCLACIGSPQIEYLPFCLTCFLNGMVIEIGRKIRAPQDEKIGVETYSSTWQPKRSAIIWLGAIFLTVIAAVITAVNIDFWQETLVVLAPFTLIATLISLRFINRLNSVSAKWIDHMSGIWTIMLYFSLGLLPLALHT